MVLLARIYYPEGYEFQPDRNNRHQLKFLFATRIFHELSEEVFFRCILRNLCRSVELHRRPDFGPLVHERFDHLFDNYLVDLAADFIEFHRIGELADIDQSAPAFKQPAHPARKAERGEYIISGGRADRLNRLARVAPADWFFLARDLRPD